MGVESENIEEWGRRLTPEELAHHAINLDPQQIARIIPAIIAEHEQLRREKIHALISGLKDNSQLEAAGKALDSAQIFEIIHNQKFESKFPPLFVGMSSQVFMQLLHHAGPKELQILKLESITEPLQHHLILLANEMNEQMIEQEKKLNVLGEEINLLEPEDISTNEIKKISGKIETIQAINHELILKAVKALSLAWNTTRIDIIDKFSKIKEMLQRFNSIEILKLYQHLKNRLDSVFEKSGLEKHVDEEPAIEALICFSIWYLEDYWKLGLLPSIKSKEDLEIDPNKSETERNALRENLFNEAKQSLSQLGLNTLKDLKEAHIYSKQALSDYIKEKL